jgi:hypothetical protein
MCFGTNTVIQRRRPAFQSWTHQTRSGNPQCNVSAFHGLMAILESVQSRARLAMVPKSRLLSLVNALQLARPGIVVEFASNPVRILPPTALGGPNPESAKVNQVSYQR